jgi:1-aminocyclopropane-1-carboxylate deaminase/D-cysteine desulfhydrase-like pyridoxal-dependent ACC family enzyme
VKPPLFRRHPRLEGEVPWLPLGRFPTAVERVEGLLPPSVELWVKREDRSGEAYGGNKVRKLEFLLAESRAQGRERVLTVGGIGSHHVLATAIYGAALGLAVEAVVFPQPLNDHVRQQLVADLGAGARLVPTRGYAGVPLAVLARRSGAYYVPGGGSSVTGTLGFVSAAVELEEQVAAGALPRPDLLYVALGSCGTAAGLIAGLGASGPEVVAVRVVDRLVANAWRTHRLARATLSRIGAPGPLAPLRVEHTQFGGAYGRATPAAEEAVRRAAQAGLILETTYTGKVMAALLADAASGHLDGRRVLFWHTYSSADLAPLLARGHARIDAAPARLRSVLEEVARLPAAGATT